VILDQIVRSRRNSLSEQKANTPLHKIERVIPYQDAVRDFAAALEGPSINLIAEIKRASPSKGLLNPNLVAASLAHTYSESGASAISVLTEPQYFHGSFADLEAAHAEAELPVLRKDFIIDQYQIYEARAHGADAVLLIVSILTQDELGTFIDTVHSLGMHTLVETHNRDELMRALGFSPGIIGINNRNLTDFTVDLNTTLSLVNLIPQDVVIVSESGIHTRSDVIKLQNAGVNAILVGEALVTSPDPAAKVHELLGC